MSEDNKDDLNIDYKFLDHQYKIAYVLRRIEDLEREHFALIIDTLDEQH